MGPSTQSGEFVFAPLGGVGEFGMNLALYGFGKDWIMIDCGLGFANGTVPGVDLLLPDPSFIAERKDRLLGLVLTHAHEDHLGAVPYLWPQLECPVFATAFTASLLRRKLEEVGLAGRVPVTQVPLGGSVTLGPFDVNYIQVTHSILEAHSLAIRTPAGTVVHSGDWKIDPDPRIGPLIDEARFRELGRAGVLALIGDSTNVFVAGHSGSEGALLASLAEIVAERRGRVAVTTFASNAVRIDTIARVAAENDRELVVVGRSLWRTLEAARENGYLADLPTILSDDEVEFLPAEHTLLLVTGCQGEPRGAMSRIARGQHAKITLGAGDTAIFSSKMIPGNELNVGRTINGLVHAGVEVITEKDRFVHVSGHPAQDEMNQMYEWLRPQIAVPVHGEVRNLIRHAALAGQAGVPQTLVIENGDLVRLAPGDAAVVDHVPTGRLALSGTKAMPLDGESIRARRRMSHGGVMMAIIVLDGDAALAAPPRVLLRGLDTEDDQAEAVAADALRLGIESMPRPRRRDDGEVEALARKVLREQARRLSGQRPAIEIEIVRLAEAEPVSYRGEVEKPGERRP